MLPFLGMWLVMPLPLNAHAAVLSLDQEKTFDRVDWSFLHATMAKTGFGPSFIGWLNLFYAGPQSS